MKIITIAAATLLLPLTACVVAPPQHNAYRSAPDQNYYPQQQPQAQNYYPEQQSPQQVTNIYEEPPLIQPEPLVIPWAPPPMLVEYPPEPPFMEAVWVGGYWVWRDGWVWSRDAGLVRRVLIIIGCIRIMKTGVAQ